MSWYYDWLGNPISRDEWARLFGDERHVGDDQIGDVHVSTVWIGLNQNFGEGPPLIFETMVFGGPLDQETWRWPTEAQAREGHQTVLGLVRLEQQVP